MSHHHGTKTTAPSDSIDRTARLHGRAARARRRRNAEQYDWRNEVRDAATLLSVRRLLVSA